jgi:hypothetical protein
VRRITEELVLELLQPAEAVADDEGPANLVAGVRALPWSVEPRKMRTEPTSISAMIVSSSPI